MSIFGRAPALLSAAGFLTMAAQVHAQGVPIARARQLTVSYNMDMTPSPDGRTAVLIRVVGGHEQLFAMNLDGSGEKQITHDAKMIHLINPDGTGAEAVTPSSQHTIHPSFTPDGKAILYCTDDDLRPPAKNESQIYSIDLATKQIKTLISGGVNTFPVMSPDGRKIAFRRIVGDMNSEVFVADSDGRNAKNLTNNWTFEGWPAWSPDGKTIAFAGNRNNAGYQIFLMNPDGSNVRLLAATEGRGTAPKWAPDGRTIYFTVCRSSQDYRGCEVMAATLEPPT